MLTLEAPRVKFDPRRIPNCILWLAADRITGLSDGDAVATWSDLSATSNHATQANAGNRPVYKTGIANGRPVVRFDGANSALDLTSEPALTTEATIFVVASQAAAATGTLYSHSYKSGGLYPRYLLGYAAAQQLNVARTNDVGDAFNFQEAYGGSGDDTVAASTFYVAMAVHTAGLAKLFALDGQEQAMTWTFNGSSKLITGLAGAFHKATIGARWAAAYDGFLNGDIAEVIIYNRKLNYGERARVLRYLKRKYKLATTLPQRLIPVQGRLGLGAAVTVTSDGTYNAFPSLCRNAAGNLLGVYRAGAGGHNHEAPHGVIDLKSSADNGATWSAATTILTVADRDCRDPVLLRLANGDIIMICVVMEWVGASIASSYRALMRSTDDGATWGAAANIGSVGVGGPPIQLQDGTVVIGGHGKINAGDTYYSARVFRSADNGVTWNAGVWVANGQADSRHYYEPNIVELGDGRLLCLIRSDTATDYWKAYSADGGLTWGAVTLAFDSDGVSVNAPRITRLSDGRLLVSTRSATLSGAYLMSWDEGATWSAYAQLYSEPSTMNQQIMETGSWLDILYASQASATDARIYFKRGVTI